MNRSPIQTIGILVQERETPVPFAESAYIRRLMTAGAALGLDIVAFDPATWNASTGTVRGWKRISQAGVNERSSWQCSRCCAPLVLYDRAWPAGREAQDRYNQALRQMQEDSKFLLLNGRLPGKAQVSKVLARCEELRSIIPPSALYRGKASLSAWLQEHSDKAFLKPSHGSQGKRVIAISPDSDGQLILQGRDSGNRPFRLDRLDPKASMERIHRWIGPRSYLMQPLLTLRGLQEEPFDVRVLMQKGGDGHWAEAGIAVRAGKQGTVTSNLHGGGVARSAKTYLTALFGEQASRRLLEELRGTSAAVVRGLEHNYGRFAELGLDYGVDREGRIWFLEANTKPGRASMACAGEEAASHAVKRPLAYAQYILLRSSGRVCHEFDLM